jgi:SAM-dependent methyltransferase
MNEIPESKPKVRTHAFGEHWSPTVVDRFGIWLSARTIRRRAGTIQGRRVGDFGCGYYAKLAQSLLAGVAEMTIVDVSLDPTLRDDPRIHAIEGPLPGAVAAIPDESLDLVLCVSVLEHLGEPLVTIREFHRILAPGGTCLLNVPSWLGKRFLELSAFRLGLSPADEMDDHKRYYDPRDLWPLLVDAGFSPRNIRCFRHKFGLNTFAVCRKPDTDRDAT